MAEGESINPGENPKDFYEDKTLETPALDLVKELKRLQAEYKELLLVERRTEEQQKRFKEVQNLIHDIEK